MDESPTLIDYWTVDGSRREALIARLLELIRDDVVHRPGFVSARVYESTDGAAVMVSVQMGTTKERQALTDSRELRAALRELRAIAQSHDRLYRLVESFGEPVELL